MSGSAPFPLPVERFGSARTLLASAVEQHIAPAIVIEVGRRTGPVWREAFGRLSYAAEAPPTSLDTVFDLASLTKVVATTSLTMTLEDEGRLHRHDPVARWLPQWMGRDRADVTIEDLLAHTAGLTAHLPLYRDSRGRGEFQAAISELPLEYPPRSRAVYSDLGFILLGFILEDAGGAPLDVQFAALADRLALGEIRYRPPRHWRARTAPTEVDPWRGRLLVGEVHDENAWALGGVAGHAGLFGTAAAVGSFAQVVLRTLAGEPLLARPETLRTFVRRTAVPGSSRALGWDTMQPTASCGSKMSPAAIGHTGFTGTSLWIDPTRDVYVVLLANRVHPSRQHEGILDLRRQVHDAVMTAIG